MTPPSLTIRRAARALSALAALITAVPGTAQAQLSLSPRPTLTIGSFDGDEMYQFHQISNVRALSDGRTLVTMGPDLRFYDRNGRFVNKAGGRGRGPGEFQYIQGLRALPGDTLLALSFRDLVTLAPDGKYVRQRALDVGPLAANGFMSEGASLLDNGNLLAPQYKASSPTDPPRLQLSRPFLRYVLFNASTGTVTPLLESGGLRQMMVGANNPAVQPFSPHAQAAVGRDRVAVGDNDSTFVWVSSPAIPDVRATWTVFDRDGRRVGALLFPERFSPMEIGADFVLGVARDEDGVEYVHRYALQRPGR